MKFDAKINPGAGFAPKQIAYQHKARAKESLKLQTRGLCKQRTKSYEPQNLSISCIAVLGRRWKFMKFDAKINPGAGFAPTQIAYRHKARAMESIKLQTRGLCKRRTKSYEPENVSVSCIAI